MLICEWNKQSHSEILKITCKVPGRFHDSCFRSWEFRGLSYFVTILNNSSLDRWKGIWKRIIWVGRLDGNLERKICVRCLGNFGKWFDYIYNQEWKQNINSNRKINIKASARICWYHFTYYFHLLVLDWLGLCNWFVQSKYKTRKFRACFGKVYLIIDLKNI